MSQVDSKPDAGAAGRVRRSLCLLLATSLLISGCAVHSATPGDRSGKEEESIGAAERTVRSDRIRGYFAEKLKRRQVVATTVTRSGQTIDWIRPETQVPGGRLALPPAIETRIADPGVYRNPFLTLDPGLRQVDLSARTELQLDDHARGPEGTVPVIRFDVERYLQFVKIPPKNPSDVLQKIPPPAPASNDRYYAVWQRFGTFFGSAGRINIWDTSGPVSNETSIAQTAVIRGDPMQAIEAGKIELQSLNGDRNPHFFTYYRTNGTASGDWVAGYNTLVDGWIQFSSRVAPGMAISAWNSSTNGNQYSLDVEVRLHQGNWWVWVAGEWAGYYPNCIGGGAPPCSRGTLFSQNGIRDQASRLDWYGEVFDESAPAATSTDMGSGQFAVNGWQHAAYFRNVTFFWQPTTYWWWDSGSITVTDATCYSANGPFYSSDPSWRNWFFYGGPGKEGSGCG
jgi:hypothetical protein